MTEHAPRTLSDILPPTEERPANCETHGAYTARVMILGNGVEKGGACPECLREKRDAEERETRERRDRLATEERFRRLEEAGIPPRFAEKTLDNYAAESPEQVNALNRCRALVEHVRRHPRNAPCLVLAGLPGNGKTHLACGIVRELVGHRTVMRRKMADVIDDIRATWSKASKETNVAVIERYASLDLLLIDEVGAGYGSDSERAELFRIIDARYERMLGTVVISNLTLDELRAVMGDRVIDRFREDGGKVLGFTGQSHRGRKPQ